jgi:predicted  nucleic acid-binding Zn-ribbon protein
MADITQLQAERQKLMQDFLSVKAELAKLREENKELKRSNSDLQLALEERETEFTNLFSYVQEAQL